MIPTRITMETVKRSVVAKHSWGGQEGWRRQFLG